jgi:hypothetical protein
MYLFRNKILKDEVLKGAHESRFIVYPICTKMYKDFKKFFSWPNIKRKIAEYMTKCGLCQQVKVKHQKPTGPIQPLLIL